MYLTTLQDTVSREGYIHALKTLANWANGNLMAISRRRLNNIKQHGDPDYVTVDTPAGEATDEYQKNDHTEEIGFEPGLTLTKRGDCYASIRRECTEAASELSNLTEFDKPRDFAAYIDSRITGLHKQIPNAENIRTTMMLLRGVSEEEARIWLIRSYGIQAKELDEGREELIAEDSTYDDNIDFEEATHSLTHTEQFRMRVKIIDGLLYEVDRLMDTLMKYPGFSDLMTKRELLLSDAVLVEQELSTYEKKYAAQLRQEEDQTGRPAQPITRGHQNRLDLFKRQTQPQLKAA